MMPLMKLVGGTGSSSRIIALVSSKLIIFFFDISSYLFLMIGSELRLKPFTNFVPPTDTDIDTDIDTIYWILIRLAILQSLIAFDSLCPLLSSVKQTNQRNQK